MKATEPIRMCVSCRRKASQSALVRLAQGPDAVRVQLFRRQGRGAYVCPSQKCLANAVKRGGVSRGLRTQGPLPTAEQIAVSAATEVGSRLQKIAQCPTSGTERERLGQLLMELQAAARGAGSCPVLQDCGTPGEV